MELTNLREAYVAMWQRYQALASQFHATTQRLQGELADARKQLKSLREG